MNPIAIQLAINATRDHAFSALPSAPTVPDLAGPPAMVALPVAFRHGAARALRWAANRIEPEPA